MHTEIIFQQLFDAATSTYTYLLGDPKSRKAILIDPVLENAARDLEWMTQLNLSLELILETHIHADHITGASVLREKTGAKVGAAQIANASGVDRPLNDGDLLKVGDLSLMVIATPGHTESCLSFYGHRRVFTGDSLLIRKVGRTDFQQGSAEKLYESITKKLWTLPDETLLFPAHDYRGVGQSTIGQEKKWNIRLRSGTTKPEFIKIMSDLKLAPPLRINEAVPANMKMGGSVENLIFNAKMNQSVPEVTAEDVKANLGKSFTLVDVRRPEEFIGELGHIEGAQLVTLGPDLMKFLNDFDKSKEIVFVCRSGGRSGQATQLSRDFGFGKTVNMAGGMLRWNSLGFSVVRAAQ